MLELQALGESLLKISAEGLEEVPVSDALREALSDAHRMRSRRAHYRQRQYIGRLMRDEDGDAIRQALDRLNSRDYADKRHFHLIEQWRDRLLADGDAGVDALIADQHNLDRLKLRSLVRRAQAERDAGRPPRFARELFRYLREEIKPL